MKFISSLFDLFSKLSPSQLSKIGKSLRFLFLFIVLVVIFDYFYTFDFGDISKEKNNTCNNLTEKYLISKDVDAEKLRDEIKKKC